MFFVTPVSGTTDTLVLEKPFERYTTPSFSPVEYFPKHQVRWDYTYSDKRVRMVTLVDVSQDSKTSSVFTKEILRPIKTDVTKTSYRHTHERSRYVSVEGRSRHLTDDVDYAYKRRDTLLSSKLRVHTTVYLLVKTRPMVDLCGIVL